MCITFIMEPEGEKKEICNSLVGKSYCFPNFFSAYESLLFTIYFLEEEGRQWSPPSKEHRLKRHSDTSMQIFDCVTNYLERPYETTSGED